MAALLRRGVSSRFLKLTAAAAMLIDHFAWLFLPTLSFWGQVCHVIGRTTIPIMCFFLAEGYFHTRSPVKYAVRLAVFALISQAPYHYFQTGSLTLFGAPMQLNVIFTLLCSLLAVWIWDRGGNHPIARLGLFFCMIMASFGDWSFFAVMFTLAFAVNRGQKSMQGLFFAVTAVCAASFLAIDSALRGGPLWGGLFQFGLLLALPLIRCYNGQRGGSLGTKWFFYLFYPIHLLVLAFLHQLFS